MAEQEPNATGQPTPAADNERSGEDVRRRGWFWHWNTIITQYAPLVGLKGVGLLNSYTVWTDRREESPHRGYAFPTQQAEAAFYGEDRTELITINKILVALDLIEIRKEMVLRVDEKGRRWRVPLNLYRVKDHPDGYVLTAEEVMRVVELAAKDRNVYRYVRRIFSPRFAPIDRDNVWHEILPIVRQTETWQRLAARTERLEARNSARTKAGHASRSRAAGSKGRQKPKNDSPANDQKSVPSTTSVDTSNTGSETGVEGSNSGSTPDVALSNEGLAPKTGSSDDQTNEGLEGIVGESNTTYNQDYFTTSTTTVPPEPVDQSRGASGEPEARPAGAGPMPEPAAAVVACYEAANGRDATPLERELLAELEAAFDVAARRAGASGSEWVVAAIREAVSSGSRFVAPKRIREILARWAREGDPIRPGTAAPGATVAGMEEAEAPDIPLPHGMGSRRTWEFTLRLLAQVIDREELDRLFAGSAIVGYRAGTVTIAVSSVAIASRLGAEYYDLIARKLSKAMRRSIRVEFTVRDEQETVLDDAPAPQPEIEAPPPPPVAPEPPGMMTSPRFVLPGGLTNLQAWAVAQEELRQVLSPANYESWIRPATLIGIDEAGVLILGAPNGFAQRRLQALVPQIEPVLSAIIGQPVTVRAVIAHEWLRANPPTPDS